MLALISHGPSQVRIKIDNLRIDNSRCGMIYSLWNTSRTTKAIRSCDTSNERTHFYQYVDVHCI